MRSAFGSNEMMAPPIVESIVPAVVSGSTRQVEVGPRVTAGPVEEEPAGSAVVPGGAVVGASVVAVPPAVVPSLSGTVVMSVVPGVAAGSPESGQAARTTRRPAAQRGIVMMSG